MAFAEYKSALPELFNRVEAKSNSENDSTTTKPTQSKGFADIIEYHTGTVEGPKVEIMPVERFLPNKANKKAKEYEDHELILRRTWSQQGQFSVQTRVELEIYSDALREAFKNIVVNSYEDTDLSSNPLKLLAPFQELFFHRDKIKNLVEDEAASPGLLREARILDDFMRQNRCLSSIIQDHKRYLSEGRVVGDILWTIYPPNSLLVVKVGMIRECWVCRSVRVHQVEDQLFWLVVGARIGFDGLSPVLARKTMLLPYVGMHLMKISELPVVPIEFCQDWDTLKEQLMIRSRKLQGVLGQNFCSFKPQTYKGLTCRPDRKISDMDLTPSKQLDERVIVDFKAFVENDTHFAANRQASIDMLKKGRSKMGKPISKPRGFIIAKPRHRWRTNPNPDYGDISGDPEKYDDVMEPRTTDNTEDAKSAIEVDPKDLTGLSKAATSCFNITKEDFELLYPAIVPAFGLTEKAWLWVLSDELEDVVWNKNAFESLQLESTTKDLVQNLIKGHKTKSASFDDVVLGKGQGLVFLLHGKPGLGKTLMAESVAEYLERPLYSISGGELSTDVSKLEERLDFIFNLSKRWKAVSLLDEADVLLCKRTSAEMERNAIVAVFLRKIEYFRGVLVLTTNRKQDFDEAFRSRINLTITFSELTSDAQSAIWNGLIKANQNVTFDDSWTNDVFSVLGKLNYNGRMIKNTLRTAVAYANAKDEALGACHVLRIIQTELKMDDEFESSLRKKHVQKTLKELEHLVNGPLCE